MNEVLKKYIADFDKGNEVCSVLMGGLSDGYESAIQTLVIETLRILQRIEFSEKNNIPSKVYKLVCQFAHKFDKQYGFSSAQVGAATNLALIFWRRNPLVAIEDMREQDPTRIITIKKGLDEMVIIINKIYN